MEYAPNTSPKNTVELLTHHHRPRAVAGRADSLRQTEKFSSAARAHFVARNEGMGSGNEFVNEGMAILQMMVGTRVSVKEKVAERFVK